MWYLLSEKDGLIDKAITKNEITQKHGKAYRSGIILDKCYYKIDKNNDELILVSSEDQAIKLGFDNTIFNSSNYNDDNDDDDDKNTINSINSVGKYVLRDYQKKQYDFIDSRIDLTDVVSISSPTGSGKTITMLQYVKDWLDKPENHLSNVVISTGFNNLVFLMEERCKEMGLTPRVLIGTKACNCPALMSDEQVANMEVFSISDEYRCGDDHKKFDDSTDIWAQKVCPFTRELYNQYMNEIRYNVGQVIITNHSSFLVHQDDFKNCSLLIVDEAHTFANFYESFLRLELDKDDLEVLDRAINTLKPPMNMIVKMNIQKGVQLPEKQIDTICDNIKQIGLKEKVREFFETKPSISNFIERNKDSYTIDHFYRSFNFSIKPKIILFSATLDDFTLNMFNAKKSNTYYETKMFCDYSKSELALVPNEDFNVALEDFLEYVNSKDLKHGLILSTTIYDMKQALDKDGILGYKMFTDINKFEEYIENNDKNKAILVGSRGLFQGIDIHGLDFVCLNKLPFPVYSEKFQAQQRYLESGNDDFNAWNQFTIPKVESDLNQTSGRLFRDPSSVGVISIFDPRCIGRFKYIVRHVFDIHRNGIQTKIIERDENGNKSIKLFKIKSKEW